MLFLCKSRFIITPGLTAACMGGVRFAEAADQGWVKAWKATEEQIVEMDARIKTIESLLGEPESPESNEQ